VFRQDAAEGHANYKHHGKHHSNYAIMSWRTKSSHLLVQEFLVASVRFTSPIFVRTKLDKTAACSADRHGTNIGFPLIGGANSRSKVGVGH